GAGAGDHRIGDGARHLQSQQGSEGSPRRPDLLRARRRSPPPALAAALEPCRGSDFAVAAPAQRRPPTQVPIARHPGGPAETGPPLATSPPQLATPLLAARRRPTATPPQS